MQGCLLKEQEIKNLINLGLGGLLKEMKRVKAMEYLKCQQGTARQQILELTQQKLTMGSRFPPKKTFQFTKESCTR